MKRFLARVVAVATVGLVATTGVSGVAAAQSDPVTLRLGYFPNVTHAPALVGIEGGIFDRKLGKNVTLETSSFNAGRRRHRPRILGGAIDACYIGPGPAISGFQQSNGEALRIVSGATSGGAFLVVKPDIKTAKDLEGKTLSTPQLGNTQDVALRTWLKEQGLRDRHLRRRRRHDPPAGELADADHVPVRRHRRRLGAGAVGDPARRGGRRQDPRRRGRPLAGRQVRHHPRDRAQRTSSTSTRTW